MTQKIVTPQTINSCLQCPYCTFIKPDGVPATWHCRLMIDKPSDELSLSLIEDLKVFPEFCPLTGSTMAWFYGKPRHEGYYWIKLKCGKIRICKIYTSFEGEEPQIIFPGNDMVSEYKELKGSQWYGPIKPPTAES